MHKIGKQTADTSTRQGTQSFTGMKKQSEIPKKSLFPQPLLYLLQMWLNTYINIRKMAGKIHEEHPKLLIITEFTSYFYWVSILEEKFIKKHTQMDTVPV